jgi:prevent-host-death family protein
MTQTVSATEAEARFGDMLRLVTERGDDVIVEQAGRPEAAIISFTEYQELRRLRPKPARDDSETGDWYDRLMELRAKIIEEMGDKQLPDVDDLINYGQR